MTLFAPAPTPVPHLLFLYLHPTSFVEDDRRLLGERYAVEAFGFWEGRGGLPGRWLAGRWLRQARWLWRRLPRADVVVVWFADYHAFLPVLLARRRGKPVAVVLGGFDANTLPELGYGVLQSRWRAPLARWVLRKADLLLPVAEALLWARHAYATPPTPRAYGVRAALPGLATPAEVIPTGYDPAAWPPGAAERPPSICTVAHLADARTVRVKGVDVLLAAARRLPEVPVTVVGVAPAFEAALRAGFDVPPNVRLLPPQPRAALAAVYAEHAVYAQLSRSEGLPNVLCEAMLCGCIPVGSPVGAIPEAIGEAGFVVETPEPEAVAAALRQALAAPPALRTAARSRIVARYDRHERRRRLFAALERLRRRAEEGAA